MGEFNIKRSTTKVNGLNLFYLDTGSDRPAMLCLHGRWGRAETWVDTMRRYHDRYRIIAPDQRGHGLSDRPVARYAAEDMATDAYRLLEKLGCGPAIVVGHSMGGHVGGYLAALYPQAVRALAILDQQVSGPQALSDLPPEQIAPLDGLTDDWPTPFATRAEAVQFVSEKFPVASNTQYFLASLAETVEGYDFLFSRRAMAAIAHYAQNWFHILPQIQCPVLLVRAVNSWCLPQDEAQRMREQIEDCMYFEVSNSDHMVYADNPDEFYPQFESFLKSVG
jgi:2-succinyl-6-hydroxy-2,4-cyclohexadiene-1-carboxylate synthase